MGVNSKAYFGRPLVLLGDAICRFSITTLIRRSRFFRRIWRMKLQIVAWLVMAAAIISIGIIASVWGRPDLTVGVGTVLVLQTNTEKMVAMILCAGLVVGGLALNISWARRRRGKVVQENPTMEQVRRLKLQRLRNMARKALMVASVLLALAFLWAEIHGWRQAHAIRPFAMRGERWTYPPALLGPAVTACLRRCDRRVFEWHAVYRCSVGAGSTVHAFANAAFG